MAPNPGRYGVTQDPHSSESASVIYGFVLLLGTPTLVCVLPTPLLSPLLKALQQPHSDWALLAVAGETVIPYYFGRVIDILGGDFDPDAFASAIFFVCLFSVGR